MTISQSYYREVHLRKSPGLPPLVLTTDSEVVPPNAGKIQAMREIACKCANDPASHKIAKALTHTALRIGA